MSQEFNHLMLLFNYFKVFQSCLFSFLVWNSFFTGQLPLNAFACFFESFLPITTNPANCQLLPTPKYSMYMYRIMDSKSWKSQTKGTTDNN